MVENFGQRDRAEAETESKKSSCVGDEAGEGHGDVPPDLLKIETKKVTFKEYV